MADTKRYCYAVEGKPVYNTTGRAVYNSGGIHRFTSTAAREAWLDLDQMAVAAGMRRAVTSEQCRCLRRDGLRELWYGDGGDDGTDSDPVNP